MRKTPNRTRKIPVQIYFDEEEISFIEKKMKDANIKNKSASVTLDPYRDILFRKLLLNAATLLLYGRALCSIFKTRKVRNEMSCRVTDQIEQVARKLRQEHFL